MQYSVEEEIEMLVESGLLTERQAQAYVYREVELVPREAAAEEMGISTSTLDDYRADAVEKVESARKILEAIEDIRDQAPDSV
jgi:DNA-directed RNA polymerase specialized sigma24 family protein